MSSTPVVQWKGVRRRGGSGVTRAGLVVNSLRRTAFHHAEWPAPGGWTQDVWNVITSSCMETSCSGVHRVLHDSSTVHEFIARFRQSGYIGCMALQSCINRERDENEISFGLTPCLFQIPLEISAVGVCWKSCVECRNWCQERTVWS